MTATDSGEMTAIRVGETLAAAVDREAVRSAAALYTAHYPSLVRLAVLLVRDLATAEEVVQDSFVATQATDSL